VLTACESIQGSPVDDVCEEFSILRDRDADEILPYDADNSPFPEVRAVIQPVDDLSLPVNTVRMWTIGLIFTIVSDQTRRTLPRLRPDLANSIVNYRWEAG
jgi:hypothetical protein